MLYRYELIFYVSKRSFVIFSHSHSLSFCFCYLCIFTENAPKFRYLGDGLSVSAVTQNETGEYTCRAYQVSSIASDMQERTILMKIERESDFTLYVFMYTPSDKHALNPLPFINKQLRICYFCWYVSLCNNLILIFINTSHNPFPMSFYAKTPNFFSEAQFTFFALWQSLVKENA